MWHKSSLGIQGDFLFDGDWEDFWNVAQQLNPVIQIHNCIHSNQSDCCLALYAVSVSLL